jgi:DedD protein
MADTQEVQQLKRRARRRLVGAIALVLFLVIVPPMLMDLEPRPVATDLTVEIPSQSSGRVKTPPPAPPTPIAKAERASSPGAEQADRPAAQPESAAAGKTVKPEADEPKAKPSSPLATATVDPRKAKEAQRVESILKGGAFVVPLGAYSNPDNVKQLQAKLARAGVRSYTEPVKGSSSTRVAAGPFATRDEAERTREKLASLKGLGVVPGTITTRQ